METDTRRSAAALGPLRPRSGKDLRGAVAAAGILLMWVSIWYATLAGVAAPVVERIRAPHRAASERVAVVEPPYTVGTLGR